MRYPQWHAVREGPAVLFLANPGGNMGGGTTAARVWLALIMMGAAWTGGGFSAQAQAPAMVDVIRPEPIAGRQTLELTGSANTERQSNLSTRASGIVDTVVADAGFQAEKGDLLLQIDPALAEADLASAKAAVREAETQLSEAERLASEAQALGENIPGSTRRTREAAVDMAEAILARRQAELKLARETLDRHRLVAPYDGVVTAKLAEAGEYVQTGTAVFDFVGSGPLRFDVQAPQDYFPLVDMTTPATIRFDALPGEEVAGRLIAKVPFSDPDMRTFLIRFQLDGAGDMVIPGMSGVATLTLPGARNVFLLPRDAVSRYPDGSAVVWTVEGNGDDGTARPRTITTGNRIADNVEVLTGVSAGMWVVVRGNETLRDGQAVRIRQQGAGEGPRNPG